MAYFLVYTTLPDSKTAAKIARRLIEEKLCACANYFPINSIYRWKDELVEEGEVGMFLKTPEKAYQALESRLKELHPYETPAILALEIRRGWSGYLKWMEEATG